ncbi:MAG: TIGR00159 family protein [Ruminococcaceae bacterium]|nr:TIGR00159 family protein [Oscillospiraceae bacterium]
MNTLIKLSAGDIGESFSNFFASVKNAFVEFAVTDAIDIVLLAAILFLGFRFFKSRKAGVLLLGVVLIVALTFVAYIFNLDATYFIFSAILDIGVLALIILFQPEIRDALEKVGTGSVLGIMSFSDQKHKRQMYSKAIAQICSAVNDLSRTKTGALIVISRTTKLDEIIETGITINSDVNSFLIRNIFFNKAPLHDGAIVIDDARIAAAGCLLPLTRRTDVDADLGTRHRAAIGMSETSDAIVIVVSEETGTISVAYDCSLTRGYTAESLRSFLTKKILRKSQSDIDN